MSVDIILESTWLTVDEAVARGVDAVEILLSNWGSDAGSNGGFPFNGSNGLPAPSAIAIGPRSTVDRAFVVWDVQKPNIPDTDYLRRVSVGQPLNFFQTSHRDVITSFQPVNVAGKNQSIFISQFDPVADKMPNLDPSGLSPVINMMADGASVEWNGGGDYIKYTTADGSNTGYEIGPAVWSSGTERIKWLPPVLELVWYLKPPVVAPPPKRYPLKVCIPFGFTPINDSFYAAGEAVIAAIPTFGRKRIVIDFFPGNGLGGGGGYDYRIAALPQVSKHTLRENNLAVGTGLSNVGVHFVEANLNADYVIVYMKPSGGAPATQYGLWATATDD